MKNLLVILKNALTNAGGRLLFSVRDKAPKLVSSFLNCRRWLQRWYGKLTRQIAAKLERQDAELEELHTRLRPVHPSIASRETIFLSKLGSESRRAERDGNTRKWRVTIIAWVITGVGPFFLFNRASVVAQWVQPRLLDWLLQVSLIGSRLPAIKIGVVVVILGLPALAILPHMPKPLVHFFARFLPVPHKSEIDKGANVRFLVGASFVSLAAGLAFFLYDIQMEESTRRLMATCFIMLVFLLLYRAVTIFFHRALSPYKIPNRYLDNGYVCLLILRIIDHLDKIQPDVDCDSFYLTSEERQPLRQSILHAAQCIGRLHKGDQLRRSEARTIKRRNRRVSEEFKRLAARLSHKEKETRKELDDELIKKLNIFLKDVWPAEKPTKKIPRTPRVDPARTSSGMVRKLALCGYLVFPVLSIIVFHLIAKPDEKLLWIAYAIFLVICWRLTPILFRPKSSEEAALINWLQNVVSYVSKWFSRG